MIFAFTLESQIKMRVRMKIIFFNYVFVYYFILCKCEETNNATDSVATDAPETIPSEDETTAPQTIATVESLGDDVTAVTESGITTAKTTAKSHIKHKPYSPSVDVIKTLPSDLMAMFYLKYLDIVHGNNSKLRSKYNHTTSVSRRQGVTSQYQIHVERLKAVNGLKKHNIIAKQQMRNGDQLIYIVNPLESNMPNAFLSPEEFKRSIENRIRIQRINATDPNLKSTRSLRKKKVKRIGKPHNGTKFKVIVKDVKKKKRLGVVANVTAKQIHRVGRNTTSNLRVTKKTKKSRRLKLRVRGNKNVSTSTTRRKYKGANRAHKKKRVISKITHNGIDEKDERTRSVTLTSNTTPPSSIEATTTIVTDEASQTNSELTETSNDTTETEATTPVESEPTDTTPEITETTETMETTEMPETTETTEMPEVTETTETTEMPEVTETTETTEMMETTRKTTKKASTKIKKLSRPLVYINGPPPNPSEDKLPQGKKQFTTQ